MTDPGQLNFDKSNGLMPCVVQDANTGKVLMLGYMNEAAFTKTLAEKRLTFFSRSKNRLWTKGESSGHYLTLTDITADCDKDTLLAKVIPHGPVCHSGADTCFNEPNTPASLDFLEQVIKDRKTNPQEGSYTSGLFRAGINKIAQKVGEEAVELVIESKEQDADRFLGEAADLMYHYLVLLAARGFSLRDVVGTLRRRHQAQ